MTSLRTRLLVAGATVVTTLPLGVAPASAATIPSLSRLLLPPCV